MALYTLYTHCTQLGLLHDSRGKTIVMLFLTRAVFLVLGEVVLNEMEKMFNFR